MDEARALLEQLMGRERDIPADKRTNRERLFTDDDICKNYLCGLCPYEDFKNTRSDLGEHPPNQDHDAVVKEQWDKLSQDEKDKYGYERELMSYLEELIAGCDRRVEKNKERLKLEQGDDQVKDTQIARLIDMEREMSEKMELSEKQAEEGLVDEAQALLSEVEQMRRHKSALEKKMSEGNENSKRDIVCEVSGNIMLVAGNILSTAENEERIRCHFQGKQYLGWKACRDKHKELKEKLADRPLRNYSRPAEDLRDRTRDRDNGRPRDRDDGRPRDRSRDRSRERSRDKPRDKSRDSPRERGSRDRSRDRGRDRGRDRSRERSRYSYNGGSDRYRRRSRSRDRDRDRGRGTYSYYGR